MNLHRTFPNGGSFMLEDYCDPLVLAQGVNQSKIRSRTMRETRMFTAHPGILEERNCYGCPDWVPQPSLSNQT
jgi:hypothetical protein